MVFRGVEASEVTGYMTVSTDALLAVDPDPQLGEHVDTTGPRVVATDCGRITWANIPEYSEHVESAT